MQKTLRILLISLVLTLPFVVARDSEEADEGGDNEDQYAADAKEAEKVADQAAAEVTGPQLLQQPAATPPGGLASPAPAAAAKANIKADARNAKEAAKVAKQAAVVANKVAAHSVKIIGHSKKALSHALGALHDARVESAGLGKQQKESLKKAEAHLREATKKADYGKLKKVKDAKDMEKDKLQKDLAKTSKKSKGGQTEKEQMRQEIQDLRKKLKEKKVEDKDIESALDDLEADTEKMDGPVHDETKAELERLREAVDALEDQEAPQQIESKAPKVKSKAAIEEEEVARETDAMESTGRGPAEVATPVQEKGLDIDTQMPYGDLEPFGREDTAQELTESSIKESDEMVDQIERAEVGEEKRAVFRALTRLRGAAITSFDGVARSQSGNIDEYNKLHKWRPTHPLHHLADEESDVTKWAFPDNAD